MLFQVFLFLLVFGLSICFISQKVTLHEACGAYQKGIQFVVPDRYSHLFDSHFQNAKIVRGTPHPKTSIKVLGSCYF